MDLDDVLGGNGYKPPQDGPLSTQCQSKDHWQCQQGGCGCRCHVTVIYRFDGPTLVVDQVKRHTRKRSERGNWLVVTYVQGKIWWATWIQTWAGVQASKRNSEKEHPGCRVMVLDIERMADFAVTEGANEIADLERMFNQKPAK